MNMPRNAIQKVVTSFSSYIENVYIPDLKSQLKKKGELCKNFSLTDIDNLLDANAHPLVEYSTDYKRFKLFSELEIFFPPVEYEIGQKMSCLEENDKVMIKSKPATGQWIPLKHTLQSVLSTGNLFHEIQMNVQELLSEEDIISNFVQGTFWRGRIEARKSENVLPIIVYYDDIETGNALGSHAGSNNLGVVYATIPCLPPSLSSKLSHIFPVLIFQCQDRKIYGNLKIFKCLIDELNDLSVNGIEIDNRMNGGKIEKVFF